ncbi:MAG: hypothetical protein ABR591_06885 [Candidatus Velthaea sp.]
MNQLVMVAGGVIAVYVVLALIVSQIVEWISTALNLRGRVLYASIVEMFSARKLNGDTTGASLVKAIYEHPLVGNLGMKKLPSYIPPRTFTLSLISSLRALSARAGAAALAAPALGDALLHDLHARVNTVLPVADPLRNSLGLIIEQTENSYDAVLKAIDNWYQAQMDRASGTFKRYTAYVQIGLGLIIVYAFRIDTFALVQALSKTAAAQSALGAAQTAQDGHVAAAVEALVDNGLISANALTFSFWFPSTFQQTLGLTLTWFAVLLGAPFWFDVLKQVMPVRLSGAKPDAQSAEKGDKQAVIPHAAPDAGAQGQA